MGRNELPLPLVIHPSPFPSVLPATYPLHPILRPLHRTTVSSVACLGRAGGLPRPRVLVRTRASSRVPSPAPSHPAQHTSRAACTPRITISGAAGAAERDSSEMKAHGIHNSMSADGTEAFPGQPQSPRRSVATGTLIFFSLFQWVSCHSVRNEW